MDLFGGAMPEVRREPKKPKGHMPFFERTEAGTMVFRHPCFVCGSPDAPFGHGVNLRLAVASKDPAKAGKWFCSEHKDAR